MVHDHREEQSADTRCVPGTEEQRLQGSPDSVPEYIVRRLIPTECARLQGFAPDWCADVPHSDSAEYKLWGNGIALPCLLPMMKSMSDILRGEDQW